MMPSILVLTFSLTGYSAFVNHKKFKKTNPKIKINKNFFILIFVK